LAQTFLRPNVSLTGFAITTKDKAPNASDLLMPAGG